MTAWRGILSSVLIAVGSLSAGSAASAGEGMWTFDAVPGARMRAELGFAPDTAMLDRIRLATPRLISGCSSSILSNQGLLLTNHHCVISCVQALSSPDRDLADEGFLATDRSRELQCPGQQADILLAIKDVTESVRARMAGVRGDRSRMSLDAAIAATVKEACPAEDHVHCELSSFFGGNQYKLQVYRKYSDVRLVFAPEYQVGQFGGVPDYFNFPRYGMDAAFLRLYEHGKPASTPNFLRWSPRSPSAGEPILVAGYPGFTQRASTFGQVAVQRDLVLPMRQIFLSEQRGRLIAEMAASPDKDRTGSEALFEIENRFKALYGTHRALSDKDFAADLEKAERDLRAAVAARPALLAGGGDPWDEIEASMARYRDLYLTYTLLEERAGFGSTLYDLARSLVRGAVERAKPDAERAADYQDSNLPAVRAALVRERQIYPWLETSALDFWLSKTREYLTMDDPRVQAMLGKESPEAIATRLVADTRLGDPKVRAALFDGGPDRIRASGDPLIRFVLAHDDDARALLAEYRTKVEAPVASAQSRIARVRHQILGADLYPDADFSLRLSYGKIKAWTEQGRDVPAFASLSGMFDRATGSRPFALPPRWLAARSKLDPNMILNFASSNDVIGGNSGSPVIDRRGMVIGTLFDSNLPALGGVFGYDPRRNRSVSLSALAIEAALTHIYSAQSLVAELNRR